MTEKRDPWMVQNPMIEFVLPGILHTLRSWNIQHYSSENINLCGNILDEIPLNDGTNQCLFSQYDWKFLNIIPVHIIYMHMIWPVLQPKLYRNKFTKFIKILLH